MAEPNMVPLSHSALSLYTQVCRPVLRELELGQTAFDILMLLGTHPGIRTARDVVQTGGIKKNLVSMNVEKLVCAGYLTREPMESDRRQVRLVLTPQAGPVVEKGLRLQKYYHDFLVRGLTPEELTVYKKCAAVIADNVAALSDLLDEAEERSRLHDIL